MSGDYICIYEDHKRRPWRINKVTGQLMDRAIFNMSEKTDLNYLKTTFGFDTFRSIEEVNGLKY
jgi:hypothetical protein